jgi:hypothetical protein
MVSLTRWFMTDAVRRYFHRTDDTLDIKVIHCVLTGHTLYACGWKVASVHHKSKLWRMCKWKRLHVLQLRRTDIFFGFVIVVMWWHDSHTSSSIHSNVVGDTAVQQTLTWFASEGFSARCSFQPFFALHELVSQCTLKPSMNFISCGWYWAWI